MSSVFSRLRGFDREIWAWMSYDFANSAFVTSLATVIFNKYYAGVIAGGSQGIDYVFLGYRFNLPGAAQFELALTLGTILTIIISPFLGAYADLAGAKKRLLFLTVLLGGLATGGLCWVQPGQALLGGMLFAVAFAAFLLSLNLYNAFLPQICSARDLGLVSGISWALGYVGGGLCLLFNLIMLENPQLLGFAPGTFGMTHVIVTVLLWWWIFSLPVLLWVEERAPAGRPVLKPAANPRHVLQSLLFTLRTIRQFRQLWIFLLAYVFFTNGIETTIYSASIFGDEELHMDSSALIVLFLLVQFAAFPGALLFGFLVDRLGNKTSLVISLCGWLMALLWVYNLGLFFQPIVEFHLAAVLVGLVLGGSQSAARSMFASFTPPARSAEFFSFFGIAGRVAAIAGPLVFAAANIATRSLRSSIIAMIAFFLIGLVILTRVKESEGMRLAQAPQAGSSEP